MQPGALLCSLVRYYWLLSLIRRRLLRQRPNGRLFEGAVGFLKPVCHSLVLGPEGLVPGTDASVLRFCGSRRCELLLFRIVPYPWACPLAIALHEVHHFKNACWLFVVLKVSTRTCTVPNPWACPLALALMMPGSIFGRAVSPGWALGK